jgi:transposase
MLDGKIIGTCMPRHRHREFLRFLKLIDQQTATDLDLHLIVDNYATHKTPAVKRWLKAHPRFHLHFTPISASWLNMVERFFAEITRNRIRRGAFKSVAGLKGAIMQYLENHNAAPKPFVWTKSAGEIIEKVARAKQAFAPTGSTKADQARAQRRAGRGLVRCHAAEVSCLARGAVLVPPHRLRHLSFDQAGAGPAG